jgi:hypothetical protein
MGLTPRFSTDLAFIRSVHADENTYYFACSICLDVVDETDLWCRHCGARFTRDTRFRYPYLSASDRP